MDLISLFPLAVLGPSEVKFIMPLLILSFGAVIALLLGTHKEKGHFFAFVASLITLGLAIYQTGSLLMNSETLQLGKVLEFNSLTNFLTLISLLLSSITVLLTYGQDQKEGLLSEIYSLILFGTAGMILMMSTNHLLFMFIALEIMSLAVYVLVAMRRNSQFSSEAGLKYFILGGLASALFLYGSSLVFGATGTFDLAQIMAFIETQQAPMIYFIGLALILSAMLFKVGAFPFHSWVPDVYQGAVTNVTAFMSSSVKITAFMAFANIYHHMIAVPTVPELSHFKSIIWVLSAASMIYGNFVAISQNEIKRMLAFSTIAHTGYLLMGIYGLKVSDWSLQPVVLYLFFYALTNLGAFSLISLIEGRNQKDITLDQLAGFGTNSPVLGALLSLFLLSMAGIPLTSGFIGKYGLFNSTVVGGEIPLVVIAVLTSVVSVYYYLRVIVYMFMKESNNETAVAGVSKGASIAAFLSAFVTLQFGLFPNSIIQLVRLITR